MITPLRPRLEEEEVFTSFCFEEVVVVLEQALESSLTGEDVRACRETAVSAADDAIETTTLGSC